MKIDFDTRTALAFIAGLVGLVEQEAVRVFVYIDPSPVLSSIFGGFVAGSIGIGIYRGRDGQEPPADGDSGDPR